MNKAYRYSQFFKTAFLLLVALIFLTNCVSSKHEARYENDKELLERLLATGNYNSDQRRLIEFGARFIGTPYALGGASPSGFDCSRFTQYVFAKTQGIVLPRTAREQHKEGYPIARHNLRPGDLVFLDLDGYLSHVGIYIGEGKFFHASSGSYGSLIVGDLSKKYFANRYNSAKRVL